MTCYSPILFKLPGQNNITPLACGKCVACRVNYREMWTKRILDASQSYGDNVSFVTFTYDDEFLPHVLVEEDGVVSLVPTLSKRDLHLFTHRLRNYRKRLDVPEWVNGRLQYWIQGEYGHSFGRPHYHAILLGIHPVKDLPLLRKCWKFGFIDSLMLSPSLIRYTFKYLDKDFVSEDEYTYFDVYKAQKPFHTMSQGIAREFCDDEFDPGAYYKNGHSVSIPRYYKNRVPGCPRYSESIRREARKSRAEGLDFLNYSLRGARDSYNRIFARLSLDKEN